MDIKISETEVTTNGKKVVGTQVSQEVYEKLKVEAEGDFMSISDLLRKIIFIHLRDKEAKESK